MKITTCPTCGSKKIQRVRRDLLREWRGQKYRVPDLEFEECADCGERLFDLQAMEKIEACSPAYAKRRVGRAAAKAEPAVHPGARVGTRVTPASTHHTRRTATAG